MVYQVGQGVVGLRRVEIGLAVVLVSAEYIDAAVEAGCGDQPLDGRGDSARPGLTQRELGKRLRKPQSWVYNCETANRRVDLTEFVAWAKACGLDPQAAFSRFLELA